MSITQAATDREPTTSPRPVTPPDEAQVEAFAGFVAGQATAAINGILVGLGDELGIWTALAASGPVTAEALAGSTGLDARLVREWLSAQAGNGLIAYSADDDVFALTAPAVAVLADPDSPAAMMPLFRALGAVTATMPALSTAFRTGGGVAWADHSDDFFAAQAQFSHPLLTALLVDGWLAAVPGLIDSLRAGGRVADVGCGFGESTILMARAFPESTFVGFDFHDGSVARARAAARAAAVDDRVTFEVAAAAGLPGSQYDVVTLIDVLHDLGDPVGAARHIRSVLAPGGVVVTADPVAADDLGTNLATNPMSALMYTVSTFLCTPTALAQGGPTALGAMAGEGAIRRVLHDAGFASVDRVGPELPFNMVMVARG